MKILSSFIITGVLASTLISSAHAATPTPTTKVSKTASTSGNLSEKLNQQINQLKDKIASRVSELNLVEKRGMIGTVNEVSANQITLTDVSGKTRFADVDEITKFSSATTKGSFGLSDLTKGTKISIVGLYNKQSKRILARFIETTVTPVFLSGAIAEVDEKGFTITVQAENQKQTTVDIGTTTKIVLYTAPDELTKYGFSKLAVGDRVSLMGYPDKKDSALIVGSRLVVLGDIPKNPKIAVQAPKEVLTPTEVQALPTKSTKKVATPTP